MDLDYCGRQWLWLADRLSLQMATNGPIRTSRRQLGRHYTSGQIYARPSFISKSFLPHIATGCVLILSHENHSTTQCQDEVRILSGRTQKLKVAKRCWKQLN